MKKISVYWLICQCFFLYEIKGCNVSVTTASGTFVQTPGKVYCSGDLIFEDNFDLLDLRVWQHENSLGGSGVSVLVYYLITQCKIFGTNDKNKSYRRFVLY